MITLTYGMYYYYKNVNLLLSLHSLRSLSFVSIHQCHSLKYFWLVEGNLPIWHRLSFNFICQGKRKKIISFYLTDNSFWRNINQEKTGKCFPNEKRCIFCCRRKITVTFIAYWKVRPTKCDFAHILEEIAKSFLWWCTNTFHERLLSPIMRWGTM